MRRAAMLACVCAFLGAACGGGETTLRASGTDRVPAAKANVVVEREGAHRDVDVQIHDLPPPEELGFSRYGVWMVQDGASPTFLGFLRYQSDIRYGDLESRAPLAPVTIVVTAEHDTAGETPSSVVIMRRALP